MENQVCPPIVLVTDFGHGDAFVGILKAVILSINPKALIVDLSHGVPPGDIPYGSFVLSSGAPFFPKGSIFCVVVDPGVGTNRKPILVTTQDHVFIGPDNGVLYRAAQRNRIQSVTHLNREKYFLDKVSNTFHGRDIFAPVAAHVSLGVSAENFGPGLDEMMDFDFPKPGRQGSRLNLTVIHKDTFGNLTLNITGERFRKFAPKGFVLECPGKGQVRIRDMAQTYGAALDNTPFILESSTGFMEIAVKNGNAARITGLDRMDKVILWADSQ